MPQDKWVDIPDPGKWEDIPDPTITQTPTTPAKEYPQLTPWQAAGQGAMGYLQGALGDLPSTIGIGLKSLGLLALNPVEWEKRIGSNINPANIQAGLGSAIQTAKMAGSEPEAFGRMMGNVTGQPLATEGIGPATRALGYPVAGYGRIMQRYAPTSILTPTYGIYRMQRMLERAAGRNIVQPLGEWMKSPDKFSSVRQLEVPFSSSGTSSYLQSQLSKAPNAPYQPIIPTKYGVVVPEEGPKQLGPGTDIVKRNTSKPPNPPPKDATKNSISSKDLSRPKRLEAGSATPPTNIFPRFK